jgi:hypothetical protein
MRATLAKAWFLASIHDPKRAPGPLTIHSRVHFLAVNLRTGLVYDADVQVGVVDAWMAAKLLRQMPAMLDRSRDTGKLQASPVSYWNAIFQIEIIGSHEQSRRSGAPNCLLPRCDDGLFDFGQSVFVRSALLRACACSIRWGLRPKKKAACRGLLPDSVQNAMASGRDASGRS